MRRVGVIAASLLVGLLIGRLSDPSGESSLVEPGDHTAGNTVVHEGAAPARTDSVNAASWGIDLENGGRVSLPLSMKVVSSDNDLRRELREALLRIHQLSVRRNRNVQSFFGLNPSIDKSVETGPLARGNEGVDF